MKKLSLYVAVCICSFWFSGLVRAQDVIVTYPPDIDSVKIDSFYRQYTIDLTKCDKPELYFEIYRWYKTCYRYGGNSGNGIDCSHFVNMLYEKIYGKKLNNSSSAMYPQCTPLAHGIDDAAEGDLLFFRIKRGRISHVAIYLQHGKFAHSATQSGVIISDINEPYYKRHFYKAGRLQ